MTTNIPFNGTTYPIPVTNDTGWGQVVTSWISDVSQNAVTLNGIQTLTNKTITFSNGSAAAPSISFTNDTATGSYLIGTSQLGFATAGTLRVKVDASGNLVVVGTANSLQFAGSTGGNPVTATATGSDSNISISLLSKGSGVVAVTGGVTATAAVTGLTLVANSDNDLTIAGGTAGNPTTVTATGSDSNININLVPKGTGVVLFAGGGLPIASGGTGSATAATARSALGIVANGATASKTSTYAFTSADCGKMVPVDATSGAWTQTLTAAATVGAGFVIGFQKIDTTYNAITVDGNSAETINGLSDFVLTDRFETIWLHCDGSNWQIINYVPGSIISDGVVIDKQTASAVANLDFFKGWNTTNKFRRMVFDVDGLYGATNDTNLAFRISQDGSTFISGASYAVHGIVGSSTSAAVGFGSGTNTEFTISQTTQNTAPGAIMAQVELSNYSSTTMIKQMRAWGASRPSDGSYAQRTCYGSYNSVNAMLGMRFFMLTGNITTGTVIQRGYR